jgi:hypothetical protein
MTIAYHQLPAIRILCCDRVAAMPVKPALG